MHHDRGTEEALEEDGVAGILAAPAEYYDKVLAELS
jgi:hypothetical protein